MLSILSGLAEGESASIAENNKWSIQRRFQNGTYKIGCSPYGYDAVDGDLIVNKQQAEIVRFIFSEVLSGKGVHIIYINTETIVFPAARITAYKVFIINDICDA